MKLNYKCIGDFISLVNNRNDDGNVENLVGLTIEKKFIPSVANTIGTDLTKYKIIKENQFACSLMQVGRDKKVPIACYQGEPSIISPAYIMFEVTSKELLPEYLSLWIARSEFDREASFLAVGGVRGNLEWEDFCRMKLPVPDIEQQRKIVWMYQTIKKRIKLKEAINDNLEKQVQALFKSWFVDFYNFGGMQPSEMKFIPLKELCKVITKGTTPTTLGKKFTDEGINFIKAESILDNHSLDPEKFAHIDNDTNTMLKRSVIEPNDIVFTIAGTLGRFALVDKTILPANTNQAVAIIRPDTKKISPSYLYSFFIGNWHNDYYSKRIQQAVQANLSLTTIKSLPIAVLPTNLMVKYDELLEPLFLLMKNNEHENRRLDKLRNLLLSELISGKLAVSELNI